jgi:hypothetical protein
MQHLISVNTSSPFIIISSSDKLPWLQIEFINSQQWL